MLPLVLGGIALAAVGYGVKELCESEGCPWDEKVDYTPSAPINTFKTLHKKKVELHENKLLKLRVLLLKIENVDERLQFKDTVHIVEEQLVQNEVADDVALYAKHYKNALDKTSIVLSVALNEIDILLEKNFQYETYTKAEKRIVKRAYKIVNATQKLLGLRLLRNKVLNLDAVGTLKALHIKIEKLLDSEVW